MTAWKTQTFPGLAGDTGSGGKGGTGSPPVFERGACLGRYLVLDLLGRGGMGEVYRAYDPELDRKVALKMLRSGLAGREAQARLAREAQAAARLAHPNVVRVYDVGSVGDRVFIAMELVEGQTLEDWLTRDRSWRDVLKVLIAAGRGLAAAHAAGLIHHDFKPGNVMVTAAGEARVIDFGIADLVQEAARGDGAQPGTPAYCAPERLAAGPADLRSDQFSFCVVLYAALCGEHPFFATGDPAGSLERLRHGEIRNEGKLRALPGWLARALRRGLRPSPAERFPNMEDLLAVLSQGLQRRRRAWLGAAAGVLLTGGVVAGSLLGRSAEVELCQGAERRLTGVWDTARKQQIQAAFAATGLPWADGTWKRIEAGLDRYAADWQAMRGDACEATHLRGEQSTQILDLRMLCLERRLAELRVVSDLFARADREVVVRASESLSRLTGLSACGPDIELTTLVPLPSAPAARQRIETLYTTLEGHSARIELGQAIDTAKAEQAIDAARSLDYPPLTALALRLRARLRLEAGDPAAAATAAEEALWAAVAGGDRLLQARLYVLLLETEGFFRGDHTAARRWKRYVEASNAALGPTHPESELVGHVELSRYAWIAGDREGVIRHARRALEIGEHLWGADDLRQVSALINLGLALGETKEGSKEGLALLERARALQEQHLGPDNPRLAKILANLASQHARAGRYQRALSLSLRSLQLLRAFDPGGGSEVAYPELLTGEILLAQDRSREAEAHLHRALDAAIQNFGAEHSLVVLTLVGLSQALFLEEKLDAAGDRLDRAEEIAASALLPVHPFRLELLHMRGRWWLERHRPEAARRSLEEAAAQVAALEPSVATRVSNLWGLGESHLGLGNPGRAREHLEAALKLLQPSVEPALRARTRFSLARALPPGQQERARRLAETARQELPGRSPWSRRLRREIEAWLAER